MRRSVRRWSFGLALLALQACASQGQSGRQAAPTSDTKLRETALATLRDTADRERKALVQQALDRYADKRLVYSAAGLTPGDTRLLAKLLEAADVVDELNLLQVNPQNLDFLRQVAEQGSEADQRLFQRNHGPWCLDSVDVRCAALRGAPPRSIGRAAWPEGFTAEALEALSAHPHRKALLSPFTLVQKVGNDFRAVPMANDKVLGSRVRRLSGLLAEAAALTDEPTLKTFLTARATALTSQSAYPYDESDLHWIRLAGPWEVTVGPYETYRNPFRVKARFGMYIGREDPLITKQLSVYKREAQRMENAVARLVGGGYKARKIDDRTAIRAIRLVRAAGDARRSRDAVVAYHLPNVGQAVEQGLTKKVLLVNHLEAMQPMLAAQAEVVLDRSQRERVTAEGLILHVSFLEFCHGFGAYPGMKIKVAGTDTTVDIALGRHSMPLEHLKAEALALYLAGRLRDAKLQSLEQRYTTAVVRAIGRLQHDLSRTHAQAAAVLLGRLLEERAARYDHVTGNWRIDYRRLPRAMRRLAKEALAIQLAGDRAGAAKLFAKYVTGQGQGVTLVDSLALVRAKAKAALIQRGIKPLSISYVVTDLEVPAPVAAEPAKALAADQQPEAQKAGAKKAGAKKAGAKKADAKKADAKKADAKKADAKKADAKKADAKQ